MRKSSIKYGLDLVVIGVSLITFATFFHDAVGGLFSLSSGGEATFVYQGFFWGGLLGGLGIMIAVIGFMRSPNHDQAVRLAPTIMILVAMVLLFFYLFYSSVNNQEPPRLRPGETITI